MHVEISPEIPLSHSFPLPPCPVQQANTIQANATAHAVLEMALYRALMSLVGWTSPLFTPFIPQMTDIPHAVAISQPTNTYHCSRENQKPETYMQCNKIAAGLKGEVKKLFQSQRQNTFRIPTFLVVDIHSYNSRISGYQHNSLDQCGREHFPALGILINMFTLGTGFLMQFQFSIFIDLNVNTDCIPENQRTEWNRTKRGGHHAVIRDLGTAQGMLQATQLVTEIRIQIVFHFTLLIVDNQILSQLGFGCICSQIGVSISFITANIQRPRLGSH